VGESAWVYYNGTDYVKLSTTVASGVTSFTAGTTGFTPSTATTGAVTLAGTLATANGGTNLTSFTSGGVVYASSTSALATGSGLTFDGTDVLSVQNITSTKFGLYSEGAGVLFGGNATANYLRFTVANAEQMRLTTTGLGIGTSSPAYKLDVTGSGRVTTSFSVGGAPTGYGVLQVVSDDTNAAPRQLSIRGTTNGNKNLFLGFNTTSDFAAIQAIIDGTGYVPLVLQPSGGNVLVGGTAARGTTVGTAHLDLFNGTAPAGTLTNGVSLYSSSGDLKFMNAAGEAFDVGYRNIPQNAQTGNYTLTLADSGDHIYHAVGAGAATYTIPANGSVAFPIGTAVTFINMSTTAISIAITTDTMYLSSAGTTGTRTLAQYGSATAIKLTSTTWLISGSGLT
jgi:hypothetical protein